MNIVFVTVSAPAVKWLKPAARRLNAKVRGAVALKTYYVANQPHAVDRKRMIEDVAEADAAFIDLMGAPSAIAQAVDEGCRRCKGEIIPYGASSRQYLRLGALNAQVISGFENMRSGVGARGKAMGSASGMGGASASHLRDLANYGQMAKYFQNASEYNIEQLLLLLAREYGGLRELPAPAEPQLFEKVSLYQLDGMKGFDSVPCYDAACGKDGGKGSVAVLFTPFAYPTDTVPCVRAMVERLSDICNVYPIGISADYPEIGDKLDRMLHDIDVDLIINVRPFRFAAGPMGGEAHKGIDLLKSLDAPMLHPLFLTRSTAGEWMASRRGCTPGEVLISMMLPEQDGSIESIPIGVMGDARRDGPAEDELHELEPIAERLTRLHDRVARHLALRRKPRFEKRVAILCYNYPPGEASLFGGAFLDTFESVAAIMSELERAGYTTDALAAQQLQEAFSAHHLTNEDGFPGGLGNAITFPSKRYETSPDLDEAWGKPPGDIMVDEGKFIIPGIVKGNVFVGLQPARNRSYGDESGYHDRFRLPHHQYAAFYQWLRNEFRADAIIHVGTHGTLEFLPGKESGVSGDCWPDRLVSDLPHFYLYYCGNPAEATIAKRRSHAAIISYQPPVFTPGELYGPWIELSTAIENYHHLRSVSPGGADDARAAVLEKAELLGLGGGIEEVELELERMAGSLVPKGLHVFGGRYTDEEMEQYAEGIAVLRSEGGKPDGQTVADARKDALRAADNHEMASLIEALDGRYIPPRLAGDIYRNPEVLPAGYNLYQFDARLIPSETAMRRGHRICEKTLQAYRADHGHWPQSTAVIAWGLETSRTQGETIGQVLAYLGVRLAEDSTVWDQKYDIIPSGELGRPRIDVTVNICGFFRDMFGGFLEVFNDILERLYDLDEPDELNYFRAHARRRYTQLVGEGLAPEEARRLAVSRVFGPREGEYGAGLTDVVESGDWEEESALGALFTSNLRFVYNNHDYGKDVAGLYEDNLRCVDVVSQLRCSDEYQITDLDHYYEFFGGLAKSVEMVKGEKASLYITDTTAGGILTETVDKSIGRGLRTRVLNPKWIEGMLEHRYHGAREVANRFENVMGLAATTGAVSQGLYDDLERTYVEDEALRRRVRDNNPHAYREILERLLEFHERGYWEAGEEQLERIKAAYLDVEDQLERASEVR